MNRICLEQHSFCVVVLKRNTRKAIIFQKYDFSHEKYVVLNFEYSTADSNSPYSVSSDRTL